MMKGIPTFININDLHEATGSNFRTIEDSFHCFRMEDLEMDIDSLPAFRSDFFTLALSYGSDNFIINLNDREHGGLKHFLICVGPGQISSFRKVGRWQGFCTFFRPEFVQFKSQINFLEDYPFFNIRETNIFPVNEQQSEQLLLNYEQILREQEESSSYHLGIMHSCFQAILWQVRRIFENAVIRDTSDKASTVIASKFEYLVNQNFINIVMVEHYAEMLNITPNHLSHTIKKATGKTAKSIISQRRAEEARYLLRHTSNDVATISHFLNFSEPAHFNNFFKKECGASPSAYRKSIQQQL